MAAIGAITCSHVKGEVPPQAERAEVWQVAGIAGYGVLLLGKGDSEFRLTAVLYSSAAGTKTWEASLKALQGTIVSITTDYGTIHANCFLARVGTMRRQAAYHPGTAITQRGEIEIEGIVV